MADFGAVAHFIGRNAKRVGVTIAGFLLILAGILMLITPGPGWAAIFAGLGVLGTEYIWARRALEAAKERARRAARRVSRRGGPQTRRHATMHEVRPVLADPPPGPSGQPSGTG